MVTLELLEQEVILDQEDPKEMMVLQDRKVNLEILDQKEALGKKENQDKKANMEKPGLREIKGTLDIMVNLDQKEFKGILD